VHAIAVHVHFREDINESWYRNELRALDAEAGRDGAPKMLLSRTAAKSRAEQQDRRSDLAAAVVSGSSGSVGGGSLGLKASDFALEPTGAGGGHEGAGATPRLDAALSAEVAAATQQNFQERQANDKEAERFR